MVSLLLALGILFLLALIAGRLCARVRIPRVTGYLLVGLAGGPSLARLLGFTPLIDEQQLDLLEPLHDLALGLIVLVIGGHFHFNTIRKSGSALYKLSALEMGGTAILVGAATFAAGASALSAGFLAIMAITTAPAATQMVIREYESEGPLTDTVMTLIGINNLAAIIAFIIMSYLVVTPNEPITLVLSAIGLPISLGMAAGAVLALLDQRMKIPVDRQILMLAMVAILVGFSRYMNVSPLLATLTAGSMLVNTSPHGYRMFRDLSRIDYPFYIIFFIMAGARLHLEHLTHMGLIGVAYVVARTIGKYAGCQGGSRIVAGTSSIQNWLGPAMLAQAGLAIGLASALARSWGEQGARVQTVVLASVVVFEGIGPLLTRLALVRAGEVTVLSLLSQRSPVSVTEGVHQVINHFRGSLGLTGRRQLKDPSEILVEHVMRRNVETIKADVKFDGVLRAFGHTRYDRLPVVDNEGRFMGVIKYADVSEVLFDPSLRNLIVAGDLASDKHPALTPRDNLQKAMDELKAHPDASYLLVVDEDNADTLVGVVRHNDVLSAQRRPGNKEEKG
jgi:Kef-type K+ transport system membrane component KefB/predicted transcriptional regulator